MRQSKIKGNNVHRKQKKNKKNTEKKKKEKGEKKEEVRVFLIMFIHLLKD
jgi:hypothetical protein